MSAPAQASVGQRKYGDPWCIDAINRTGPYKNYCKSRECSHKDDLPTLLKLRKLNAECLKLREEVRDRCWIQENAGHKAAIQYRKNIGQTCDAYIARARAEAQGREILAKFKRWEGREAFRANRNIKHTIRGEPPEGRSPNISPGIHTPPGYRDFLEGRRLPEFMAVTKPPAPAAASSKHRKSVASGKGNPGPSVAPAGQKKPLLPTPPPLPPVPAHRRRNQATAAGAGATAAGAGVAASIPVPSIKIPAYHPLLPQPAEFVARPPECDVPRIVDTMFRDLTLGPEPPQPPQQFLRVGSEQVSAMEWNARVQQHQEMLRRQQEMLWRQQGWVPPGAPHPHMLPHVPQHQAAYWDPYARAWVTPRHQVHPHAWPNPYAPARPSAPVHPPAWPNPYSPAHPPAWPNPYAHVHPPVWSNPCAQGYASAQADDDDNGEDYDHFLDELYWEGDEFDPEIDHP